MRKFLRRLSWFLSIIFFVVVVYPLAIERFVSGNDWKSMFASYYLKDEDGKLHAGFFSWARLVKDIQFFEYAWEVKKERDLSYWRYNIAGVDEDKLKRKDGFLWADKGFLWSHQNL